jgi:4,5:9,10-diseco-3-hydroxy-5,9,17-trioxoandrosta-1(10),2-diene-4-oate hydrolase
MRPSLRIVALLAVAFACRARDVSEATPPARSSLAVEYRVIPPPSGCGPVRAPVVFLPALGFTGHSFAAVASNMSSCRPRILVDLPALDQVSSTRVIDAVAGVIADQSAEPVILVGHSIGGAIATRLAARHPERVAALVLVDAAVTPFDLSWWERLALRPSLWSPALRVFGQPAVFKRLLPEEICDWDTIDDFDLRKLAYQLGDPGQRRILLDYYQAFLSPIELQRTEMALGLVRAPVLILWGRRDGVVPSTVVSAIRGAIAPAVRVDVRWFPQAAHLLPMERPEAVARALDDLDRRLASAH